MKPVRHALVPVLAVALCVGCNRSGTDSNSPHWLTEADVKGLTKAERQKAVTDQIDQQVKLLNIEVALEPDFGDGMDTVHMGERALFNALDDPMLALQDVRGLRQIGMVRPSSYDVLDMIDHSLRLLLPDNDPQKSPPSVSASEEAEQEKLRAVERCLDQFVLAAAGEPGNDSMRSADDLEHGVLIYCRNNHPELAINGLRNMKSVFIMPSTHDAMAKTIAVIQKEYSLPSNQPQ